MCTFVDLLNLSYIYINVVWFSSGLMILVLVSIDIILKHFHIMFYQSIFSLQKNKRTARKKLYYLLLISKFEGILHIIEILGNYVQFRYLYSFSSDIPMKV